MIVHVRGTNGAGKTRLVRAVMDRYKRCKPVHIDGRKHPIGYICDKRLFVLGHYEGPTGGCDTIGKVDLMHKMINKYHMRGLDVLFEGIVAQHSIPRILALHARGFKIRVVSIDVSTKKAIRSVQKRRKERGNTNPFNPQNLIDEVRRVNNGTQRLIDGGVKVYRYPTRSESRDRVFRLLGLT